ncbi:MAG: DegT/DnrJ/EryC1/StrS family aminotransferase [Glaciimonas sp.]|nr:DegT/DnrJ/EryC1/StrS family aminotransferase [Glaciimonas sp.]
MKIDIKDFSNAIESGSVNVALVIHYFGFCRNDMTAIKTLCNKHNVLLVEDCAHAFQIGVNNQRLGNYGDYSFYSLHKHLATSAGGALKINTTAIQLPKLPENKHIATIDLEQYAKTQFDQVADVRRNNFLSYTKFLPLSDNIKVMFDLIELDVPQSFPILVKNSLREKLYFYLIENNMPVTALYYRMINQLTADKFPISFVISHEILNLPVHQDVNEHDIEMICNSISIFLNNQK